MKFNIGKAHIELVISTTSGVGDLFHAVLVTPIGDGLMFAGRLELSNLLVKGGSAIPASSQTMLYKQGSTFAEDIVRGWFPSA